MNNQKGATLISWIALLAIVLFNAIIAMNVVPVYLTDHSVKSLMAGLESDSELRGASPKKIRETVVKRLRINNIYDIKKDQITLKKSKNDYLVIIEYEPRGKLVANLEYIVLFKHEARVPAR